MRYIKTYEKFTPLGIDLSIYGKKKFWRSIFKNNTKLLTNAILKFAREVFKEYHFHITVNKNGILIVFEERNDWIEFYHYRETNSTEIIFLIDDKMKFSYISNYFNSNNFRNSYTTRGWRPYINKKNEHHITGLELNEYLKFVIEKYSIVKGARFYKIENEDIPEIIKELNIDDYETFNNAKKYNL